MCEAKQSEAVARLVVFFRGCRVQISLSTQTPQYPNCALKRKRKGRFQGAMAGVERSRRQGRATGPHILVPHIFSSEGVSSALKSTFTLPL